MRWVDRAGSLVLGALVVGAGCASTRDRVTFAALPRLPDEGPPSAPAAPSGTPARGGAVLTRTDVETLLGRGFAAFLGTVEFSPVLLRGRFVGFRLERADDLSRWRAAGADIRPGDVITRVNGHSVERPETAHAAFVGLRVATELRVELLRGTEALVIRQPIVDNAVSSLSRAGSASVAPAR